MSPRGRSLAAGVVLAATALGALACAPRQTRALRRASHELSRAVKRSDADALRRHVVAGGRGQVDTDAMLSDPARREWSKALADPDSARPEAVVLLGPEAPVGLVWTDEGWRFAEDPTDVYAQRTPRQALRALVRATRAGRWDVLLQLAPRRYRLGLSEDDLRTAWTDGEQGTALRAARDRLATHLADPIVADADEATLDMGQGHVARLEREGDRWVVVEF